jgi:outer membrane protein assembly factor BamB
VTAFFSLAAPEYDLCTQRVSTPTGHKNACFLLDFLYAGHSAAISRPRSGENPMSSTRLFVVASTLMMSVTGFAAAMADDVIYFDENGGTGGPRGLYTLDTATGIATLRVTVGGTERFFSMTTQPSTGRAFAMQVPGSSILWNIDLDTGVTTMIANTSLDTIADITFDPRTGDLYGLERNGTFRLFKIDPVTGSSTLVGPTGSDARAGLVFSPAGDLFAFSVTGHLYSVDKTTGATRLIGGGGIPATLEDAVFTPSGKLFVVNFGGEVYQVDPATGSNRLVHTTGLASGLVAIVNVPAQVCYPDCDQSTGAGVLDIFDFLCFQDSFVSGQSYACDCDTSTGPATCDIFDFLCFQNAFVAGCR